MILAIQKILRGERIDLVIARKSDLVFVTHKYSEEFIRMSKEDKIGLLDIVLADSHVRDTDNLGTPSGDAARARKLRAPNIHFYSLRKGDKPELFFGSSTFYPRDRYKLVFDAILTMLPEFARAEILYHASRDEMLNFRNVGESFVQSGDQEKIKWNLATILGFDQKGHPWLCGENFTERRLYRFTPEIDLVHESGSHYSCFANFGEEHVLVGTSADFVQAPGPNPYASGLFLIRLDKQGNSGVISFPIYQRAIHGGSIPLIPNVFRLIHLSNLKFLLHTNAGLSYLNFERVSEASYSLENIENIVISEEKLAKNFYCGHRISYDPLNKVIWIAGRNLIGFLHEGEWHFADLTIGNKENIDIISAFGKCYFVLNDSRYEKKYESRVYEVSAVQLMNYLRSKQNLVLTFAAKEDTIVLQ